MTPGRSVSLGASIQGSGTQLGEHREVGRGVVAGIADLLKQPVEPILVGCRA